MTFVLPFPAIDPVLIEIGPLAIRWYALAYIAGLLIGWWLMKRFVAHPPNAMTVQDVDDFLVWATLGVILGGRIGHVLFYGLDYYLENPLAILRVWEGGMSFHGGLIGVIVAMWLFARKRGIAFLALGDAVAVVTPIGLFFGRIANFINGELWGRPSDVPWAMVFPRAGPMPRHPSQLYEALLEGMLLFSVLWIASRNERFRARPGMLGGIFLIGYGIARATAEFFREPDAYYALGPVGITIGQLLSLPFFLFGLWLVVRAQRAT